jgi:single-strand DNA-binding protein
MTQAINKVILIGNLGRAPELTYLPSGDAVVNASLATTDTWKDRESGEKRERTEWHRLTFYRGLAEVVGQYLTKGSRIFVEGRLTYRSWVDSDGKDLSAAEIEVERMLMLDGRTARAEQAPLLEKVESGATGVSAEHAPPSRPGRARNNTSPAGPRP